MVAFLLLMALLRPAAQKAPEVNLFILYIIGNKQNPKTEVSNNLSGVKKNHPRNKTVIKMTRSV